MKSNWFAIAYERQRLDRSRDFSSRAVRHSDDLFGKTKAIAIKFRECGAVIVTHADSASFAPVGLFIMLGLSLGFSGGISVEIVPRDLTLWQFLNSQLLATAVGAFAVVVVARTGGAVQKRLLRLGENAVELLDNLNAKKSEQEAAIASETKEKDLEAIVKQPFEEGGLDYRMVSKDLVDKAKAYINDKIGNERNKRYKRTYESIPRYDWLAVAFAMYERNGLNNNQLAAATTIFSLWKQYERGKASKKEVSQKAYNTLRDAYIQLTGRQP